MWSQLQTHMRALQNDTYLRTLAYLPRMMGAEAKRKYHAFTKQWYQDHACHGAARVERETRMPIRVCIKFMHRLCVPTTQSDMQQLLQIERTEKSHHTVREWFTAVEATHRQVVALGKNPEYIATVNTEATKIFVSQLTKQEYLRATQAVAHMGSAPPTESEMPINPDTSVVHSLPEAVTTRRPKDLVTMAKYPESLYETEKHKPTLYQLDFQYLGRFAKIHSLRRTGCTTRARLTTTPNKRRIRWQCDLRNTIWKSKPCAKRLPNKATT